jgi:hypothetical protein
MIKIIALDIDENCVVAVELIKEKGKIFLGRYKVVSNLKELINDPFFKKKDVVINLSTQAILLSNFRLPTFLIDKSKSLRLFYHKKQQQELVKFLLHQNLPFKLEECFWDTFVLNTNLNLIMAKRETVENYINQVEQEGLRCLGLTTSLLALYNIFIYNYPEKKEDRFAILNIRNSTSDLLIYETKRLWIYPISLGKRDLDQEKNSFSKFSLEIQRIFNAHYLQKSIPLQTPNYLYLNIPDCPFEIKSFLKESLSNFEILDLDPLKKIDFSKNLVSNKEILTLSLGIGLTYLGIPPCRKINLIKERIREISILRLHNFLKRIFLSLGSFGLVLLLLYDINLIKDLKNQKTIYKNT